jgi:hypothetical protein
MSGFCKGWPLFLVMIWTWVVCFISLVLLKSHMYRHNCLLYTKHTIQVLV